MDEVDDKGRVGPWPKGMNNRAAEYELAADELRLAHNVDITNRGTVRRRVGRTALLSQGGCHSVFGHGDKFLFVQNGTLYLGLPPAHVALRTGLSQAPMAYVEMNGEIYFSNGEITGKVTAAGAARPWGVPTPSPTPVVAATGAGGLAAGRYQVAFTWVDDRGEESGAAVCSVVDVAEGGGIAVSGIPAPTSATITYTNVYVSKTNDDQRYLAATIPAAQTTYTITAGARGRPLATLLLQPFPPCTLLEKYNGRIFGAKDNVVYYSEALRYGLSNVSTGFMPFANDVSVLKAVGDGVYVCADKTFWHGGGEPAAFTQKAVLPFGAVPGTGTTIENTDDVAWFSKNGWIIGKDGGQLEQVTDTQIAPASYNSGVALFREHRGMRQLVSALRTPTDNAFVATDFAEAEVIRRKV